MRNRLKSERGAALLETAITLPLVLLVSVGIFEFARAYQTSQILTNAAREAARVAILPATTDEQIQATVTNYLAAGGVPLPTGTPMTVNVERAVALGANTASR